MADHIQRIGEFPLAQAFTPGLGKRVNSLSPIYGAFVNALKDEPKALRPSLLKEASESNCLPFPRRERLG